MLVPPGWLREYAAAAARHGCRARAFEALVRQVRGWLRRICRGASLLSILISITKLTVQNHERKVKWPRRGAGCVTTGERRATREVSELRSDRSEEHTSEL